MIKIKNLTKTYFSKKKVVTNALNDVSFETEDKGMIFLLGKSGSGKSTLLNLIGGLDTPTSGEIIVENNSLKDLKPQDLDSYRNTFVSFVFQEYNLIEDFSAFKNIALGIELQNQEISNEKIDEILKKVDLDIDKTRNVNELSGGQKQRIAIARALIKNSKIILADEPSGALDQDTGNQIFELLKNISKEKLVIVVSHDKEFAEKYADRIIELSDGKIISDTTNKNSKTNIFENITFEGDKIIYPKGYNLTENELEQVQKYINQNADKKIKLIESQTEFLPKEDSIDKNELENNENFKEKTTDTSVATKENSKNTNINFVKSKLSLKKSFKLGVSNIKCKKLKLVVTILLCVFAFSLLGVFYALNSYNSKKVVINAFTENTFKTYYIVKYEKENKFSQSINDNNYVHVTNEVFDDFCKNVDSNALKAYGYTFNYLPNINNVKNEPLNAIYSYFFSSSLQIDQKDFSKYNINLLENTNSRMPNPEKNEILISKYRYEHFHLNGYKKDKNSEVIEINTYNDLIGKYLGSNENDEDNLKIVGIFDTHFDESKYLPLLNKKYNDKDYTNLQNELMFYMYSGFETSMIFGNGYFDNNRPIVAIMGNMPTTKKDMNKFASYIEPNSSHQFDMTSNQIYTDIYFADDAIKQMAKNIAIIGIIVLLFAYLLLSNFMSISINNKQKEIGILRGLGARKSDILKIFIVEVFVISIITTILSSIAGYAILKVIETELRESYVNLKFFFFSISQILFILLVSLTSGCLTTYFAVQKYMRKNPIESINKRL